MVCALLSCAYLPCFMVLSLECAWALTLRVVMLARSLELVLSFSWTFWDSGDLARMRLSQHYVLSLFCFENLLMLIEENPTFAL